MQRLKEEKQRKRNLKDAGHKLSLMGNILDIKSKRKQDKQKRAKSPKEEKSYTVFVPDIDNFEGVKEIKNFCIASLIDNGYGNGERSEGVL